MDNITYSWLICLRLFQVPIFSKATPWEVTAHVFDKKSFCDESNDIDFTVSSNAKSNVESKIVLFIKNVFKRSLF